MTLTKYNFDCLFSFKFYDSSIISFLGQYNAIRIGQESLDFLVSSFLVFPCSFALRIGICIKISLFDRDSVSRFNFTSEGAVLDFRIRSYRYRQCSNDTLYLSILPKGVLIKYQRSRISHYILILFLNRYLFYE